MNRIMFIISTLLISLVGSSQNPLLAKDEFPENNNGTIGRIVKTSNYTFFNEPNLEATSPIVGQWIIAPETRALKVGPTPGSDQWWYLNKFGDDIAARACYLDDKYVFNENGSFNNILGSETFLETWQGVASDRCGAPVAPHNGPNANYVYDQIAGTITLNGQGAYLGLPKVVNGYELPNGPVPNSITYNVTFSENGNTMTLSINFGAGYWTYKLIKILYVNDNSNSGDVFTTNPGDNTNPGTPSAPFATISHAISVAPAGTYIYVDAGNYAEQVIINKGITIIGAGQTLSFFTPPATTLVPAPGPFTEIGLFETSQGIGDVHIRNLSINSNGNSQNIIIQGGGSVKNCTLLNGQQGIFFRVDPAIKTALIENNIIEAGIGINCQGSGLTATIRNNTISRASSYYAGIFAGLDFGPLPQLTIQNNIINNFNGEGILAASFNGTYTLNSITGTGTNAINRNGNGGNTPTATCNWFGTSNAATVASKIVGTVIYTPFLTDGTDGSSNVGFQPIGSCGSGNTFYVNNNITAGDVFTTAVGNNANPGTAAAPFATLQHAVNTAAANDIIYVDAGTYTEQVTITKGITIIGAGQNATSILKPAVVAAPPVGPSSFNEPGVIQTAQNIGDVNIKDLSVTGDYTVNVTPIIIQSGGSVRNCKLQSGNQGIYVRIDATTNPGAKTFYIEGNTIDAEYIAVNVIGTSLNAILSNNTLAAYNAGFSTGLFAGQGFGPLGRLTATNNLFSTYHSSGIQISASNASITQNAFTGTGALAINRTGGANITANCNWYGVATASAIVPKINAGVNYYPWYVDGTDVSPVAGFQHYSESCGGGLNFLYVNDNNTTGDLFTTTTGDDANTGTPTSPLATFGAALIRATPGTVIYMDAGTYTAQDATIDKQVQVIGTNFNVSPNSAADPLLLSSNRNAETIIENTNWIIGAHSIYLDGLTFNPLGKQAITLNNTTWSDTRFYRNRLRISSNLTQLNFTGSGTTTMALSAIANWGLNIRENRFEKEDALFGTTLLVSRYGGVNINNNSFVVTGTTVRTQTAIFAGSGGVVNYLNISNNTFDRASTAVNSSRLAIANINFNKIINTSNAFFGFNPLIESSEVGFRYNTLDGSAGIFPFIQYTRQGGNAVGATSSFTAEENTITGTAVAGTTTLLGSMNLIFFNSVLNPSLTVRNNKMTYAGDLSTVAAHFIRPIMIRGNLANTIVEKNEINLTGINQQQRTIGVDLPVSPAITLYTDNTTTSFLQSGSVINIFNNKINGFKHSFAAYDATSAGNDAYVGYGNIPAGVTVNINNNSFTGDSISINNGTVGQPVLATCNWYSSADASVVVPKISGIATYSPWLTNGTDNDVATGFQPVPNSCNGRQNKFYVNDGDITGDVFTTAVGNDTNTGIHSAPLATVNAAIIKAQAGDTIYMDAGTYAEPNLTIGKSVTILGSNYLVSPNDATNPLNANGARTTEAIISNTTWTIGASDIKVKGLTFDPQSKNALVQSNNTLDFDNIEISNNIFLVTSTTTPVNLLGKQQQPLVTFNYSITNNRFMKSVAGNGSNISMTGIDGILISGNTFTTSNSVADWTQNAFTSAGFRTNNFVISNNTSYRTRFTYQSLNAIKAQVINNKAYETVRFLLDFNGLPVPTEIDIADNVVTIVNSNGGPVLSYSRSSGTDLSAPNIARIERNFISADATGWTNMPQALIAPTLDASSANTQVFIRNNKLTITGDFSSLSSPSAYVSAIRYLTNSRYTLVENNEMEFTATNYNGANKFGIGVLHIALQPGTGFNFLNNKFSGFPTSIGIQNNGNGGVYGELPTGVVLNINYNSFTGDVMSINNGVTGQSALASCNWYGSAAAQNFITKLTLPTVDIIPWLTNGTDNDVATGFQPVPGSCDGYPTLITLNSSTNVTCNGAANGTINVTTTYGKAPFTYTWTKDGDANFVSNNEDLTDLAPGTYRLAITDGNGSNIYIIDENADGPGVIVVTITEPDVLTASASGDNNVCFNGSIGTASVVPTGGTAPYTYLWSNGATTDEITNLIAGTYSVTITDANGCTTTASYEVTQPTQVSASITNNSTACANIATVAGGEGTPGYTYLWSNGSTSATISGVPVGTYTVTVTDNNGCTATASITLSVGEAFNPSASVTNVTCFGANDGIITVTNANGTGQLMFSKDGGVNFVNGSLPFSFTNLAPGTYNIAVKDVNGCTGFVERIVTQPTQLTTSFTVQKTCEGLSTGSINVTVSGGSPAYSYSWTGLNGTYSSSQLNINNLAAGSYSLTVTDKNNCTVVTPVTVIAFPAIVIARTITDVACRGGATGAINITATGGTGTGFTYSWTGGIISSIEDLNTIAKGTYKIRVTDNGSGCIVDSTFIVTEPATNLSLTTARTNATGCNSLGTITGTGSGGTAPYSYNINGGAYNNFTGLFTGLYAGSYTIGVKDANGCTTTKVVSITDTGADAYEGTGPNKNNTRTRAFTIPIETVINARIPTVADSLDWYKFTSGAAGVYTVTFNHPNPAIVFDVYTASGTDTLARLAGSTPASKKYNFIAGAAYNVKVYGGLSFICYSLNVSAGIAARVNNTQIPITESKNNPVLNADVLKAMTYPNPHRGSFTLRIESPEEGVGTVEVYNVNGQLLSERKVNLIKGKGNQVQYNSMNQAILFYRVKIGKHVVNGKIIGAN